LSSPNSFCYSSTLFVVHHLLLWSFNSFKCGAIKSSDIWHLMWNIFVWTLREFCLDAQMS
jgi:hypothetical protein